MNIQYKRACFTSVLFGVLFFYLLINFVVTGVDGFTERFNFLITALMILLVMVAFFWMLYRTNKKEYIVDERDNQIQTKATSVSLLVTTMFVFLMCIGLFLGYENSGMVPVSWMWLLAYLTFDVAYFSSSSIIVLLYWKDNADK